MRKEQKRQLLSNLKQISQLDRRQRFSEKVFRHLRSNNQSNDASFQRDDYLPSQNITPNNNEPAVSPTGHQVHQVQSNLSGILQQKGGQRSKQSLGHKSFDKLKKFTQETGRSFCDQQLSYRNQSSERMPRFSKNKPQFMPSQTMSTMTDFYTKFDAKLKDKCPNCIKRKLLRDQQVERLIQEIKQLKEKLQNYEQKYASLKKGVEPYINNVSLMSVILESLTEKDKDHSTQENEQKEDADLTNERNELKETAKINMWLLKQGMQKDKNFSNQKYRLKCEIDSLAGENIELKKQIKEREQKLKTIQQQLKSFDSNHPIRERLQMCGEQLYSYKLKYQQKEKENENLSLKIQELKYKLNVLTSLIGCAIIFDVHEKEKDKKNLKQILNKIDKFQNITHNKMDNNVFQYLKILKVDDNELASRKSRKSNMARVSKRGQLMANQSGVGGNSERVENKNLRKLFYPNYLVLLGEESISSRLQHIVIKPTLFIKIRSILDSKYIDYRLYETAASKFSQFCNTHIRSYQIPAAEKKPYYITRNLSENEIKEMNLEFIRCLMDERIEDIPEIQIFRQLLFGKYEEDEIYFYLMCRHKFVGGSELQNYINSGDPSKFIKFDKAKRIVIKITEKFGRSIQNFICHHLNERKIVKGNFQFIRLYYLLKLLLLVYRKIRTKKLFELKELFDHIMQTTQKNRINFMQFYELLRKNFQFLTRTDICSMYQTTVAIFQSQTHQGDFFQSFAASCGSRLLFQEMIKFDAVLSVQCQDEQMMINYKNDSLGRSQERETENYKFTTHKHGQTSSLASSQYSIRGNKALQKKTEYSAINELWPDSVYVLGSEKLNKQYFELSKLNPLKLRTKIDTLQFLLHVILGHLVKQDIYMYNKEDLSLVLGDAIHNLVEYLNKLQKNKLQHENEINLASRKLGKFFKNKVYEFYHEMLQDINSITNSEGQEMKNSKKYNEHKKNASIFHAIK